MSSIFSLKRVTSPNPWTSNGSMATQTASQAVSHFPKSLDKQQLHGNIDGESGGKSLLQIPGQAADTSTQSSVLHSEPRKNMMARFLGF
ncbi:unnamed protein product [Ilex paraguariensis]|uniref:Uncharacterized protein n=1 Tax=Ilex paraguariensis TaxID=185542 RepID=A0ABC8RS31_9AQUA